MKANEAKVGDVITNGIFTVRRFSETHFDQFGTNEQIHADKSLGDWTLLTPSPEAVKAESKAIDLLKKLRNAMGSKAGFHTKSMVGGRWQREIDELLPREPSLEERIEDAILVRCESMLPSTRKQLATELAALLKENAE